MRAKAHEQHAQRKRQAPEVELTNELTPEQAHKKSVCINNRGCYAYLSAGSPIFLSEEHKANGYASVYQHWNTVCQPRNYTSCGEFVCGGRNKYNVVVDTPTFLPCKKAIDCKRINLNAWIDDLVQEQSNQLQTQSSHQFEWFDKFSQDHTGHPTISTIWWNVSISSSLVWKTNVQSLMFQIRLLLDNEEHEVVQMQPYVPRAAAAQMFAERATHVSAFQQAHQQP